MYQFQIVFTTSKNQNISEFCDAIDDLTTFYYTNGQSLSLDARVYYRENVAVMFPIALERDSFEFKNNSNLVNEYLNILNNEFNVLVEHLLIDEDKNNHACQCNKHNGLSLMFVDDYNCPLFCLSCGLRVPLYRYLKNDELSSIVRIKNRNYRAWFQIYMTDSLCELWSEINILGVNSELAREGIELCNGIEAKLNIPVYYEVDSIENKIDKELPVCLKCGSEIIKGYKKITDESYYCCNKCRIIYDYGE